MTERWLRSLAPIDEQEPAPDLWNRAVARSAEVEPIEIRSDARRRIWAAAVATLVAAAGLGGAFLALTGSNPPVADGGLVTYRDPAGWEITYPARFIRGPVQEPASFLRVSTQGTWFSNFGPPAIGPSSLPAILTVPPTGMVVQISQRFGGPMYIPTQPDSRFPVSFPVPDPGQSHDEVVTANGDSYTVQVRVGSQARPADRQAAAAIVRSMRFLPLTPGTAIRGHISFYVLDRPAAYPVGSVTRFGSSNLATTEYGKPFPFYLVHVPGGFYALAWPADLAGGYKHACGVRYEPAKREFSCANGGRWALDGSVIARPSPASPQDRLSVLLVRVSLDGHILVSPNVFGYDIKDDLRLTRS